MLVWALIVCLKCVTTFDFNTRTKDLLLFEQPGGSVTMTCKGLQFSAQWYKEDREGQFINIPFSFCESFGTPKNHKYSADCKSNSFNTLTINNMSLSDAGIYYCTTAAIDPMFDIAKILITTDPNVEPTISILGPMEEEVTDTGSVMLLCVIRGWSDKLNPVRWHLHGKQLEGLDSLDLDGSYWSLIVVKNRNALDYNISCSVEEISSKRVYNATFSGNSFAAMKGGISYPDCYVVVYIGIAFVFLLLLIHRIILIGRKKNFLKGSVVERNAETVIYTEVKQSQNQHDET